LRRKRRVAQIAARIGGIRSGFSELEADLPPFFSILFPCGIRSGFSELEAVPLLPLLAISLSRHPQRILGA